MKFLVDANLPSMLSDWLIHKGFDSIHTLQLELMNQSPDGFLFKLSMTEARIVLTKDHDFFDRYIMKKEPYKLIFVSTGNLSNKKLILLFENNWETILNLISQNQVIEVSLDSIIVHF